MKKQLIVLCLLACNLVTNAQTSSFKAGAYYNAEVDDHKLSKISYPGFEFSVEQSLGKKFSISGSYSYAKAEYSLNPEDNPLAIYYTDFRYVECYQTLTIEGRYYLKTNNSGIFFQMGIPFTYITETSYSTKDPSQRGGKGYSYAITTIGGLGIKYPLSPSCGIEMNTSYSPRFNFLGVDYGSSGFIKSGLKFVYSIKYNKR